MLKAQETVEALGHDWGEWKTTKEPEVGKAGERQRSCTRCGKNETEPVAALIGYSVSAGGDGSWTKGSGASVTITVKRSENDADCFSHYKETQIDGKSVTVTAKAGSTVVTISADELEKLSVGKHTITVTFDDGQAETTLTVKAATDPTKPQTGDESDLALWALTALASGLGLCALAFPRLKKRGAK